MKFKLALLVHKNRDDKVKEKMKEYGTKPILHSGTLDCFVAKLKKDNYGYNLNPEDFRLNYVPFNTMCELNSFIFSTILQNGAYVRIFSIDVDADD